MLSKDKTQNDTVRTVEIINQFKGMPEDTWSLLKALLCATHSMDSTSATVYGALIDTGLIAKALDEINRGNDDFNPWDLVGLD